MSGANLQILIQAALEHHRANRLAEAEPIYRGVLTIEPANADALHLLGILCGQTGRHAEGIGLLDRACAAHSHAPTLWLTLGNLLYDTRHHDRAILAFRRVLQLDPRSANAHNNLGNVFIDQKRYAEAIEAYRTAIRFNPQLDLSYCNLGVAYRAIGQIELAIDALRKAVELAPQSAIAHDNLGLALADDNQLDAAVVEYQKSIQLQPTANAFSNLSVALRKRGQLDESHAASEKALALQPSNADALNNFGITLAEQGKLHDAIAVYRRAIELQPNQGGYWTNLGISLGDAGQYEEAAEACRKSVFLNPADPTTHFNLGVALLTLGEFDRGWEEYEWRWKIRGLYEPRGFPQPIWDGKPLDGKRIFIHADQGFGDTIQFVRYAKLVNERGGRVVLGCDPPLVRLMRNVAGIDEVVTDNQSPGEFAVHCSVVSLPAIFRTNLQTIPAEVPYISPIPRLVDEWRQRIGPSDGGIRVGLVWAGRPTHKNDRNRSMSFSQLTPLANERVSFFSLQKGAATAEAVEPAGLLRLVDWTHELHDFADTASLIANLDLVISVDTSVVHLAGAMGKRVWALLPFNADWRWMTGREDSPWYSTMRLFRQKQLGNWDEVVQRVRIALTSSSRAK